MNRKEKLIYTSGIMDGEGCLRTYVVMNGRKEKHRIPIIAISQKDIRLLKWIKENFGGYIHQLRKDPKYFCYQWQLRNKKAIEFIKELQPYLIIKDIDAKRFLNFTCEFCGKTTSAP